MQKLFIRVGSHYYAETPQLEGDLELSSLIGGVPTEGKIVMTKSTGNVQKQLDDLWEKILAAPPEKPIDYKKEIEDLNKRIDDLTELIKNPPIFVESKGELDKGKIGIQKKVVPKKK